MYIYLYSIFIHSYIKSCPHQIRSYGNTWFCPHVSYPVQLLLATFALWWHIPELNERVSLLKKINIRTTLYHFYVLFAYDKYSKYTIAYLKCTPTCSSSLFHVLPSPPKQRCYKMCPATKCPQKTRIYTEYSY